MPWDDVFALCWSLMLTSTMSTIEYCVITVAFGVFLETNNHQHLTRPIGAHFHQCQCHVLWNHVSHVIACSSSFLFINHKLCINHVNKKDCVCCIYRLNVQPFSVIFHGGNLYTNCDFLISCFRKSIQEGSPLAHQLEKDLVIFV